MVEPVAVGKRSFVKDFVASIVVFLVALPLCIGIAQASGFPPEAGLITGIIGGLFVWRGNLTAIWVTGMIGGLADLGYLLFVDFPGYVNLIPGTLMTVVSGTAIALSFWVWLSNRGG